jgi:hypothetical protein
MWKTKLVFFFLVSTLCFSSNAEAQTKVKNETFSPLDSLLSSSKALKEIIKNKDKYRVQIIYTKLDKNAEGELTPQHFFFNVNEKNYFYPASLVKLPLSIFAIEKINSLKHFGISIESKLSIDSAFSCQKPLTIDVLSNDSIPCIKNYISKALIVSDNESYNRLFEFVSPAYCFQRLNEIGLTNGRIISRFSSCDSIENRHTNPFKFYNLTDEVIYEQGAQFFEKKYSPPFQNMEVGTSHYSNGKVIKGAKDFSKSNCFPLKYMHDLLMELIYPSLNSIAFSISESERKYLLKCLSSSPQNCNIIPIQTNPMYNEFMTNYLYYGAQKKAVKNPDLEIYNIVGQSYGFLSDISYFQDTQNEVEFFLSAVIYANTSEVVGNGGYQYETIGFPFLQELGKTIYDFEIKNRKGN